MAIFRAKIQCYVLRTVVFIIYEINRAKIFIFHCGLCKILYVCYIDRHYSDLLKWINLNLTLINLNLT